MRVGLFGLVVGALAIAVLSGCHAQAEKPAPPRAVVAQRIVFGEQSTGRTYSGAVHAHLETPLGFRIPGKIVARNVKLGESVRRGTVLARLDAADAGLNADTAAAGVAAAQSDFDIARREYARYGDLVKRGLVSRSDFEQRENNFNTASARLTQARKTYDLRRNEKNYTELVADRDGVITQLNAENGQVVAAGQAVVTLAANEGREIFIDVPENDIDLFKSQQQLSATLWALPDREFPAAIVEIAAAADPATRTFLVKVNIPDAPSVVRIGMTANVHVRATNARPAALIPLTALHHSGDQPAVWVIDKQKQTVSLQPIAIDSYGEHGVLVRGGIPDGALIVTKGVQMLYPGQSVIAIAPTTAGAYQL